jgi:hypothetical protein
MVERPLLTPETDGLSPQTIWIVFSNDTDIRPLKILKKGFRHCFVILQQDARWMLIDPRCDMTEVKLLPHPVHFNFPRYFQQQGKIVLKVPRQATPRKVAPLFPMSCVETVKRMIGLHRRFILTPHQLYKYLTHSSMKG